MIDAIYSNYHIDRDKKSDQRHCSSCKTRINMSQYVVDGREHELRCDAMQNCNTSGDRRQTTSFTLRCNRLISSSDLKVSKNAMMFSLCNRISSLLLAILLFASFTIFDTRLVEAVHINSISAPQSFRVGEANSVILDCDFALSPDDDLVVVKWFLNDDKQHIYQWIQSRDSRTYSAKIKPYIDETFVVGDHPTRHRALRLLNPPASLSGKYTCSVSSLADEDSNSTHLVIYEPPASFQIAAIEVDNDNPYDVERDDAHDPDDDGFNITCTAIGVFPEPEIKLYHVRSSNEDSQLESTEIDATNTTVLSFRSLTDGLYSITLSAHIVNNPKRYRDDDIITSNLTTVDNDISADRFSSPARERLMLSKNRRANIAEHYECRLTVPFSEFTEVKRIAIQDGWRSKYRTNSVGSTTLQAIQTHLYIGTLFALCIVWYRAFVATLQFDVM